MEILSKLFGGSGIVKTLRLFLFNPEVGYEVKDVIARTRASSDIIRDEIRMLAKIGFLKKKSFFKDIKQKKIRRRVSQTLRLQKVKRKRVSGWVLNKDFPYLEELKTLLIGTASLEEKDIVQRLRKVGTIKLIIASGIFVQNWDSRLDLLIVGDGLKHQQLTKVIKEIEAELGREIRYAVFGTSDFKYRLGIYDRLVRDVFDYPHRTVVDKIGLSIDN